jgi:protease PrsW
VTEAGFAAFESAGYALGAMIQYSDDHPLLNPLETEALRAALAPFGHITWTAILGGALFASAWPTGRMRFDRRVFWTAFGVIMIHGSWDASYGWAIRISRGIGGEGWTFGWPNTAAWVGTPSGSDLFRFQIVYYGLLIILGVIGLVWALRRWRAYQSTHGPPTTRASRSRRPSHRTAA